MMIFLMMIFFYDDDNLDDMTVVAGNTLYWDNSGLLVVGPWLVMLVNFIWRDGGSDEEEEPPLSPYIRNILECFSCSFVFSKIPILLVIFWYL